MSRMGGINTGVSDTKCAECGKICQCFKAPNGKLLCADCLWKVWGIRPQDLK